MKSTCMIPKLNPNQRIMAAIDNVDTESLFFLDGPGSSGKTFLYTQYHLATCNDSSVPIAKIWQVKVTCQAWVKGRSFIGDPRRCDFQIIANEMPPLKDGEILVEALCWTVDNYMKVFDIQTGSVMPGEFVGSILDSRHKDYPLLTLVICPAGWQTHTILKPDVEYVKTLTDMGGLPVSLCLGTTGMPGLVAYFGLLNICKPEAGDKVLVNAAAGSVGNVVGQIAKIQGCTVIAFAGSKDRCDWVRELGFDFVFNYNTVRVSSAVKRVAPGGLDFFFDCVGSKFTVDVLSILKPTAIMCMCGYSNAYGRQTYSAQKEDPYRLVYMKERQVQSTSLYKFEDSFEEAEKQLLDWVHQGRLKYREILYDGFERLPEALVALYDVEKVGKIIVKSSHAESLQTQVIEY